MVETPAAATVQGARAMGTSVSSGIKIDRSYLGHIPSDPHLTIIKSYTTTHVCLERINAKEQRKEKLEGCNFGGMGRIWRGMLKMLGVNRT